MEVFTSFLDYLKDPETPFGVFDLAYGFYFLLGFIRGSFRGLPEELSQLLGTVIIFVASMKFYQPVSAFIIENTRLEDPLASKALAYLLLFLCLLIVWRLLTYLIRKTLDWSCPIQLKRFGGSVIGLAKSAMIVTVILAAILISGHRSLTEATVEKSWFGRHVQNLLPDDLLPENSAPEVEQKNDESGDA